MATRFDGQIPGLNDGGIPGQGGVPVFTLPAKLELDEFDLDVQFGTVHLDLEGEPHFGIGDVSGCLCRGATGIDTVAGATCVNFPQTNDKFCLSYYRCITIGNRTCPPCVTVRTCSKVTACNFHTQFGTCGCATPTSSGVECG